MYSVQGWAVDVRMWVPYTNLEPDATQKGVRRGGDAWKFAKCGLRAEPFVGGGLFAHACMSCVLCCGMEVAWHSALPRMRVLG